MKPPYEMRYAVQAMDPKNGVYPIYDTHENHRFGWIFEIKPNVFPPAPKVECPKCHGYCIGHLTLGYIDPPENCFTCHNTGVVDDPNFRWDPQPSAELLAALQKAWRDEWNRLSNEHFQLRPDQ